MYYTWKFRTYGTIKAKIEMLPELTEIEATLAGAKIEGQLAKLDKLEMIEKSLEKAKFDVQMERIDEILKLEKAKSEGSSSVEFEYYQRKEDSEKIMIFAEKITQINIIIRSEIHKSILKCNELHKKIKDNTEKSNRDILDEMEPLTDLNEYQPLQNQVTIMYKLYFEHYNNCNEFKRCMDEWAKATNAVILLSLRASQSIRLAITHETDRYIINQKINDAINTRSQTLLNKSSMLHKSEDNLIKSLSEIIKEIRQKTI